MFQIVHIEDSVWYAPDVGDNHEKPEEERFRVLLAPMTSQEQRRVEESRGKISAKFNAFRRHNKIRETILGRCIVEVENCSYVRIVNGERIVEQLTNAEALLQVAGEDILEAIYGALKDQSSLAKDLLGKSSSPSDSSRQETNQSCDGAAASVDGGAPKTLATKSVSIATATGTQAQAQPGHGRPVSVVARGRS